MVFRCYCCKADKDESEFPRNASRLRGVGDWCKDCKNAQRRARPPEQKRVERLRWRVANPEKYRAHKGLQKAVAFGRVARPDVCERCGVEGPVHGHHPDYEKRLEVVWLCPACHGEEHSGWTWPVAA